MRLGFAGQVADRAELHEWQAIGRDGPKDLHRVTIQILGLLLGRAAEMRGVEEGGSVGEVGGLCGVAHARNLSALPTNSKRNIRHCRFIFACYGLPMSFASDLAEYSAPEIIAAIGCSRGTAYDWLQGRREPPEWQQPHWLALIRRATGKKSNKSPHGTTHKRSKD